MGGCKVQGTIAMFIYCCRRCTLLKKLLTHILVSVPRGKVKCGSPCSKMVEARLRRLGMWLPILQGTQVGG